jgi:hypothetical protein
LIATERFNSNELSLVSRTGLLNTNNKVPWLEGIELINGGFDFLGRIVQAAYYCGAIKKGALFDSMGTAEAILRTHVGACQ